MAKNPTNTATKPIEDRLLREAAFQQDAPNEAFPEGRANSQFLTPEESDKRRRDHLILQFAVGVVGVVAGAGVPQNAHDIAHAKDNLPVVKRVAQNTIIVATHLADAYLEATK